MYYFMILLFGLACFFVPAGCLVSIFFGESQRKRETACQVLIGFCVLAIGIGLYINFFIEGHLRGIVYPLTAGLLLLLFGVGELFLLRRKR